jgi:predicted metal-binding protein
MAKKMGAAHAVVIEASGIVLDPRTYLKCMYGCKDWGKNWTCPSAPGAVRPWEFGNILKRYKKAVLVHCRDKKQSQRISMSLEREAFLDGHYFAFSMSDCALCKGCAWPAPCRKPREARPSMQALGIDVYATARRHGLPISVLRTPGEPQNWYSLVLIE